MVLIKKKKKKTLFSRELNLDLSTILEIKETQNAKALSAHHGWLLKLFSLQTKSPQLGNESVGVRERVSGDLPLTLVALVLVLQWPTIS